jgi:hypothetical protein
MPMDRRQRARTMFSLFGIPLGIGDIAILVTLIITLASYGLGGANDGTARKTSEEAKQGLELHKKEAEGDKKLILQRLDDLKAQNMELQEAIKEVNQKLDRR